MDAPSPEDLRLAEDARREKNWKRWGPYLAERQWGTVREDYSPDGDCWNYFTHDHARSRAYRWGEDGLLGICDRECRLCFSVALWNGKDPILKERLFGLTGPEGNHGEDVKEQYFYLDATPTHSYLKALYRYPQAGFPYERLVEENRNRSRKQREFEILDTGVFDEERYFDVFAEHAKNSSDDLLIKLTVVNRGPDAAVLHLLPQLFYRNTWAWGCKHEGCEVKPRMRLDEATGRVVCDHVTLGRFYFAADVVDGRGPQLLFTENETNLRRVFDAENYYPYVRDAFHDFIVRGRSQAISPKPRGTKLAAYYGLNMPAGATITVRLRLWAQDEAVPKDVFGGEFDDVFKKRIQEADAFWAPRVRGNDQQRRVARQAYAGMLWGKQFYHYIVKDWLDGDPAQPPPPPQRKQAGARNADWEHLYTRDVISMPDKWEYPWFAAWDHGFHTVPFARMDGEFAKQQLVLLLREWYMHPSGQLPAYEFAFGDANPPVHAWATWRVYKMTGPRGRRDRLFLARAFHKLLINFTWWVNRKDVEGRHLFGGGFLGLDNIGLFDRSKPLPNGAHLDQADGTAWMAFYCATMLAIALELASEDPEYEDVASKFFEHFVAIADAMNCLGGTGLWDEEDGFYYDQIRAPGHAPVPLRIRSYVGLIPLLASEILEDVVLERLPGFRKRMDWFLKHRQDLARHIAYLEPRPHDGRDSAHYLLAIPSRQRLERVLRYMLDEKEFLSPFGVRSLSRYHKDKPFIFRADGREFKVTYCAGESDTDLFGGNSNWRGPVWFPINYLLIEALERFHYFYGDSLKVECPVGSGRMMNLWQVSRELATRLCNLFLPDAKTGLRPVFEKDARWAGPNWRDLLLFHEYFDGDTGRGLGASHQTGWTGLVTDLLYDTAVESGNLSREQRRIPDAPSPGT
ncbi:MAG: MGH1-like glycoside hydrolase domain-containing protein, partial [Tepidisphaeraceae bacterium]